KVIAQQPRGDRGQPTQRPIGKAAPMPGANCAEPRFLRDVLGERAITVAPPRDEPIQVVDRVAVDASDVVFGRRTMHHSSVGSPGMTRRVPKTHASARNGSIGVRPQFLKWGQTPVLKWGQTPVLKWGQTPVLGWSLTLFRSGPTAGGRSPAPSLPSRTRRTKRAIAPTDRGPSGTWRRCDPRMDT